MNLFYWYIQQVVFIHCNEHTIHIKGITSLYCWSIVHLLQVKGHRKGALNLIYGLDLMWSTPLSTVFYLHRGCLFYWWRKPEYRRKPPTYRKALTNFITKCCIEYTSILAGFELTTLVVKGTGCTGSCKSSYHTIITRTVPSDIWSERVNTWSETTTTIHNYKLKYILLFQIMQLSSWAVI